jgi:hypothetical protein
LNCHRNHIRGFGRWEILLSNITSHLRLKKWQSFECEPEWPCCCAALSGSFFLWFYPQSLLLT